MNLSQLQAECGKLLNDPNNTRWSAATLLIRLNLAQTEVQGYTNAVKTRETVTTVANQATYTLDSDTMDIVKATITKSDGSIVPFQGISQEELYYRYPDFTQWEAGEPRFWWYEATLNRLIISPVPDAANVVTNGITLFTSLKPDDLVASTDIPFDSNNQMVPYHMSIVNWTVAQCWMDDGTPESLGKAMFHKSGNMSNPGQYELQLKRIMDKFDFPEDVDAHVRWKPQGGRLGTWLPSKGFPLGSGWLW